MPPVTALRSPPLSRMTGRGFAGDGRFIHGGDAFDDLAVGRDHVARLADDEVALLQVAAPGPSPPGRLRRRRAIVSLRALRRLSAWALPRPFGDGLGEVGEQHREPEPEGHLRDEAALGGRR